MVSCCRTSTWELINIMQRNSATSGWSPVGYTHQGDEPRGRVMTALPGCWPACWTYWNLDHHHCPAGICQEVMVKVTIWCPKPSCTGGFCCPGAAKLEKGLKVSLFERWNEDAHEQGYSEDQRGLQRRSFKGQRSFDSTTSSSTTVV